MDHVQRDDRVEPGFDIRFAVVWLSGNACHIRATREDLVVISRAVILFVLTILGAIPGCGASEPQAPATPAVLTRRVPPAYPAKAIERGQEGWVDVSFTITPEGTTSTIRIIAEYPRHVFARSAINAVAKWTYAPRLESGTPVPQSNNRTVLSFALRDSRVVRQDHVAQFTAAYDAIATHDWDRATKVAMDLGAAETLNLFELASLEEIKGRIAFGRQRFALAADHLGRALEITSHFSPEARDAIYALLVRSKLNSGDAAGAVSSFDRWNPAPREDIRELRRAVETAREGLGAAGP
jgi:TonB family protein